MSYILSLLPDAPAFSIFMLATLAIGATPGPGMMFGVAQAVAHGRRAGAVSVLGLSAGSLTWCFAGAFGIAAFFTDSPVAFRALLVTGASFLIYLAVRTVLNAAPPPTGPQSDTEQTPRSTSHMQLFFQAVTTNLTNPKSVLFYLAFIPQFTDPARGNVTAQFILLGVIFNITGNLINLSVALLFGNVADWLAAHPKAWRMQQWFSATVFCAIAAHMLWSGLTTAP